PKGEIAGDQAHHDRARNVDDEGAVGKRRAKRLRGGHVHGVAQRGAKPAADKDQEVVHPALPVPKNPRLEQACAASTRWLQERLTQKGRQRMAAALRECRKEDQDTIAKPSW